MVMLKLRECFESKVDRRFKSRAGGTLVEVMISILIVGVVIVPAVGVFTRTASNYNKQAIKDRAFLLASDLISEIVQQNFTDPETGEQTFGPEEASRASFDDVDDYNGFSESPPVSMNDSQLADSDLFTRTVGVEYVVLNSGAMEQTSGNSLSNAKLITVNVQGPGEVYSKLTALRTSNGTYEIKPINETVELQKVDLEVKSGSQTVTSSVDVVNQFPQ